MTDLAALHDALDAAARAAHAAASGAPKHVVRDALIVADLASVSAFAAGTPEAGGLECVLTALHRAVGSEAIAVLDEARRMREVTA